MSDRVNQEIYELAKKIGLNTVELQYFENAKYTKKPVYYSVEEKVELSIKVDQLLDFQIYDIFVSKLKRFLQCKVQVFIECQSKAYRLGEINKYVQYIVEKQPHLSVFMQTFPSLQQDVLLYRFLEVEQQKEALEKLEHLRQALIDVGIEVSFEIEQLKIENNEVEVERTYVPTERVNEVVSTPMKAMRKLKVEEFPLLRIQDIQEGMREIRFVGKIYEIDNRLMKSGKMKQLIYVSDAKEAIAVQRFEQRGLSFEEMSEIKEGDYVEVAGSVEYNQYQREIVCNARMIQKSVEPTRKDTADKKRIELHLHTKLSEMDGVSSIDEYIKQAVAWGHDAIAITDHNVVQAYPSAQRIVRNINRSREKPFKMIYGIEMSMVEPHLNVVYNPTNEVIESARYCIFDLETTGLSTKYDHIIEFGAKIVENRTIKETMQVFIKPPVLLSAHISELTNISNHDLENAKSLEEVLPSILNFMKGCVLVAHNASFDINFLNDALLRLGQPILDNPVIDTLDLAKALIKDRRGYRLGNIARYYKIKYDADIAHRADYDANVLAEVFLHMMNALEPYKTLKDLCVLNEQVNLGSLRERHVIVLAKNVAGIKDIFDLVTLSHTKYLAEVAKSNNKPICQPRILKDVLDTYRKKGNLLLGSSCVNSEVFQAALTRSDVHLSKLMEFYDYIEIQPIENYSHLVNMGTVSDVNQVKIILQTIVDQAKKLNKIVVATGDAHYVSKDKKQVRDIFINAQGIGGVRHPLYIYNANKRQHSEAPDQHFKTTDEMLKSLSFLNEDAYQVVVENTHKIYDLIEFVEPIKDDLYPPQIEGCAQMLTDICMETAHSIYGEVLPKIVEDRLKKELDSIIGNGFEVVYYVSHLLVKQSLDDGYLVGSRGSVGSSFAATMANITEVNPLAPHYICPNCQYSEFVEAGLVQSGFDLPDKKCPHCGHDLVGEGQNIPFETFLGFEGDKVPDIDLNFSGEYQEKAHKYIQKVFGKENAFRAGTIATVANKTAFGYVKGYLEEMGMEGQMSNARMTCIAKDCDGVRRSTGQHPGGIIVFPQHMSASEFTPVQFPSNNPSEDMQTTHLDYHDIEQNVLKFDILGHVDPTAMKLLEEISGVDVRKIPMNDKATMAIFSSVDSLMIDTTKYREITGAAGIPEFGTGFVRGILESTKPTTFDELLKISGLSHGTDVWLNNAKDLIDAKLCTLKEVIGCRDDIMVYLMQKGMEPKLAFTIMESVRKGKGLKDDWIEAMKQNNVEEHYIESCQKIKYMFPKAHAVAYVMMAVRIAYFKVHYPLHYYCMYFSIRCDAYDLETMVLGEESIKRKMSEISSRLNNPETKHLVSDKDKNVYTTLELALEMVLRGYRFHSVDINHSDATRFTIDPENPIYIYPSFISVDGLGENVALSILSARKEHAFLSKQDLASRTLLSTTLIKRLASLQALGDLQEENQMTLF